MHENREISCTSWSTDQDRSAKAINRTAEHARTREVGLCRSTCEPVEQRSASFRGGWGGKGTDQGEHRSITQAPDTERETLVPGIARCATSSISKEAGTVHRFTPPPQRRSCTRELLCPEASSLAGSRSVDLPVRFLNPASSSLAMPPLVI